MMEEPKFLTLEEARERERVDAERESEFWKSHPNLYNLIEIIKDLQSKEPWYIQKAKELKELIEAEVNKVIKETLESDLDNSKS